jgi:hypothetical protein
VAISVSRLSARRAVFSDEQIGEPATRDLARRIIAWRDLNGCVKGCKTHMNEIFTDHKGRLMFVTRWDEAIHNLE